MLPISVIDKFTLINFEELLLMRVKRRAVLKILNGGLF